jgi:hypothetical protein
MGEPTVAELLARIEQLEGGRAVLPAAPVSVRRRSFRRRLAVAVTVLAVVVGVPAAVYASHAFSDVPTGASFHTEIGNVEGAAITGGCGGGKYCPTANVTRGQMAAFLGRGLGRAAADFGNPTAATSEGILVSSVTIKPGAATGGTVMLQLTATVHATIEDEAGCPCETTFWIQDDTKVLSFDVILQNQGPLVGTGETANQTANGATSFFIEVPSGVSGTYDLIAQTTAGTGEVFAYGDLSAAYVPFGPTGGNDLGNGLAGSGPRTNAVNGEH